MHRQILTSKRAITKIWAIVSVIIIAIVGAGVGIWYMTRPSPELGAVKIGALGWMGHPTFASGVYATKLAVDEINKTGGILGRPVEFIMEDGKHEVPTTVAAYKKLVTVDKVSLVVVSEGSEVTLACQEAGKELYPEYPHIMMAGGASSLDLPRKVLKNYDAYKFFYDLFPNITECHWGTYEGYIPQVIKPVASKVALIFEDAEWTIPHRKGDPAVGLPSYKELFEKHGIKVVYYAETSTKETMFLPIFEEVARSGAEWMEFVATHSDIITFTKQWAESPAKDIPVTLWGGHNQQPAFWGQTGGKCLGTLSFSTAFPVPLTEKTVPFVQELTAKYEIAPSYAAYPAYDGVYLFKAAVEKVGSLKNMDAVVKALEEVTIQGTTGIYKIKPEHQVMFGYPYIITPIVQWQGENNVVVVYPPEVAKRANPGKGYVSPAELRAGGR